MPGGDGSGPSGMGPMTGRAAGYCAGYAAPGFASAWGGRGGFGGFGRGGGRGWRNRFYATGMTGWQRAGWGAYPLPSAAPVVSPETELEALKSQARSFQGALDGIQKRIEELEKSQPGQ